MSKGDVVNNEKNSFPGLKIFSETLSSGNVIYQDIKEIWSVLYFNEMMHENEEQVDCSCRIINKNGSSQASLLIKTIEKIEKIDEITGIYNRHTFKEKVIEKIKTSDEDFVSCFIIISVENFEEVNSIFGYTFGDKVLRSIARTISLILNKDDIFGRLIGTKFLIYINNASDLTTVEDKLELLNMAVDGEIKDKVTLSLRIGIAVYGQDCKDADGLFEKAETALSHAKKAGKNPCYFYYEGFNKQFNKKTYEDDSVDKRRVDIRTFGYFDLFIDGQAILIPNANSKELLALLVDRKGGFVTPGEIISVLWEDEGMDKVTRARTRKIFMLLKDTLKEYGIDDILESNKGARRIRPEKVNCDLFNYLSGDVKYAHLYKGHYMLNYSWSEYGLQELKEQAEHYTIILNNNY